MRWLILESGEYLLLESGGKITLEAIPLKFNNFEFFKAPDGISVGERIR